MAVDQDQKVVVQAVRSQAVDPQSEWSGVYALWFVVILPLMVALSLTR